MCKRRCEKYMTEIERKINSNKMREAREAILQLAEGAVSLSFGRRKEEGGEEIYQWQEIYDIHSINTNRPLFRTLEGHDHTDFVIDTDVEILTPYVEEEHTVNQIREMKLRAVMKFWEEWDKENPEYTFTSYITGQGMYRIQRYDQKIDKSEFINIIWGENAIFKECPKQKTYRNKGMTHRCNSRCKGFFQINKKNTPIKRKIKRGIGKIIEIDNIQYLIIIDTSLYKAGRHVYRLPYTPYTKLMYETFYCVPVVYNEDGSYAIEETIKRSRYNDMVVTPIFYEEFQFENIIEKTRDIISKIVNRENKYVKYDFNKNRMLYKLDVPPPEAKLTKEQKQLIKEMRDKLNSTDPYVTPPCIYNAWKNKRDHWMRMIIVRYLASLRYDDFGGRGYTADECALFVRFAINDEEDNSIQNRNKIQLVSWVYGDPEFPDMPPHCDKMQDEKSEFYCCTSKDAEKCGRSYCMFKKPIIYTEKETPEKSRYDDKNSFEKITSLISEMVQNPETNYEAIKTTRAGFTTSLIRAATFHNKKLLVITPTNRISREVFTEAMRLIHDIYGENIEGAVLSANLKACLKLRFTLLDLEKRKKEEPDWGDNGIQWKNLMFQSKPSCIAKAKDENTNYRYCEYYEEVFEFPHREGEYPVPIIMSQYDSELYQVGQKVGKCAYRTIVERINDYDVIFITYDKLTSLLSNVEKEAQEFITTLYQSFDIVFMDEISKLVQSTPLEITVYEQDDEGKKFFDFTYELSQDVARLIDKYNNKTVNRVTEIADTFIEKFDPFIRKAALDGVFDKSVTYKIDNFMDEEERIFYKNNFFSYYAMISRYAKDYNVHLNSLEKMLVLLQNESWWMQSTPTPDKPSSVIFTTSPKLNAIKDFAQTSSNFYKNQLIVTDATMPLVKVSDILGVELERYVVGDPRNTCDKQLIICGRKTIPIMYLKKHSKNKEYIKYLINFINSVCTAHGTNNVMLVLPNKRFIYRLIQKLKKEKFIPWHLEVTWYRSDKTVGVGSKKRVMITVCPPTPPKYSYLWLARYYHEEELFTDLNAFELSSRLEQMNMHQTFYQTIGRVKDPKSKERSIVYCWGISYSKVKEIIQMDEDVPIPHISVIDSFMGIKDKFKIDNNLIKIGKAWLKFGVILDGRFIRFIKYFETHDFLDYNSGRKTLFLSQDYLYELSFHSHVLNYFGITYFKNDNNEIVFTRISNNSDYYINKFK